MMPAELDKLKDIKIWLSADREFICKVLQTWLAYIETYSEFHIPPKYRNAEPQYVWDHMSAHIEMSQVANLVAAAWGIGGVGVVEISSKKKSKNKKGHFQSARADFYICSPPKRYSAFEGEAKAIFINGRTSEAIIKDRILKAMAGSNRQITLWEKRGYKFTPTDIVFIRARIKVPKRLSINTSFDMLRRRLVSAIGALGDSNQISAAAYIFEKHASPIKWNMDYAYCGIALCIRENKPDKKTQ